ncbi:MAG: Nramp family divalent metal transporter [Cyclobacteriaceae bacterium]
MKSNRFGGPGMLVAAAFIGPGTLTVCTLAGVGFGYDLIWVLVFATFATIVLQGMASRLGLVSGAGLGEALRLQITHPILKVLSLSLVFIAIIIGNAAYEMGNITGAVLGLESDKWDSSKWGPILIGVMVAVLLWSENFKRIQLAMALLVAVMSLVFVTTAIMVISWGEFATGLVPSLTPENQLMALGLIGTTIVPYNLFLHASATSRHWNGIRDLPKAKWETIIAIGLGGIISVCVLVTATSGEGGLVQGVTDMSRQLEPMLGRFAKPFMSIGIFAAGISSALTAPLAASLTAQGIFGWQEELMSRLVWGAVLLAGVSFSLAGFKPISVIQVAQIANGILLPIIVVFLIAMCNRTGLMGEHRNGAIQNILAGLVLLVSLIISFRSFNSVFHFVG